jgi:hypothetical protein
MPILDIHTEKEGALSNLARRQCVSAPYAADRA